MEGVASMDSNLGLLTLDSVYFPLFPVLWVLGVGPDPRCALGLSSE